MATLLVRGDGGGLGTVEFPDDRPLAPEPDDSGEPFGCQTCGSLRACWYDGDRDTGPQFRCVECGHTVILPLLAPSPDREDSR